MKNKKILLAVLLAMLFVVFAMGSGEDTATDADQGSDSAKTTVADNTALGDYSVEIAECRLAKDFEDKDVVIIKYKFTNNNNDTATAFFTAFDDAVYQNGVGLNEAFVLADSAEYDSANQTKEIKKGATIDVEVAYELNDTETDVEVEVSELFSFEEKTITKTFTISE